MAEVVAAVEVEAVVVAMATNRITVPPSAKEIHETDDFAPN